MSSNETPGSYWKNKDIAQQYYLHITKGNDHFQDLVNGPALLALLPDRQYARILEGGCGAGFFTSKLLTKFPSSEFEAIDISPELISFAQSKEIPGINFQVGDISDLHFPDGSFELVVYKMVFPSIPRLDVVFNEAARVLRPNGILAVSTLHPKYHRDFLAPRADAETNYFAIRNFWASLQVMSIPVHQEKAQKVLDKYLQELDRYPDAIWVQIAGSPFRIPTFLHSAYEMASLANQAGFKINKAKSVRLTDDFAYAYMINWLDRIGWPICLNIIWEKC